MQVLNIKNILGLLVSLIFFILPVFVLAVPPPTGGSGFGTPTGGSAVGPPTGGSGVGANQLVNPLGVNSFPQLVQKLLQAALVIGIPVAVLFIVWAGFLLIKAQGNSTELGNAKKNLGYVIFGAILILSAWVLATIVGGTVMQLLR